MPPRAACVRSRYDPSVASASRTFCLRMHSHRLNGLRWVALLPSVQALTTPPPTLFCISFIAPYASLWQTARLAHLWVLLTCLDVYFLAAFSSESRPSAFQFLCAKPRYSASPNFHNMVLTLHLTDHAILAAQIPSCYGVDYFLLPRTRVLNSQCDMATALRIHRLSHPGSACVAP